MLDPQNFETWTALHEHPACEGFRNIYQYYVHAVPAPSEAEQRAAADRDIANLADTCRLLEAQFGAVRCELVLLDDLTTFVRISHDRFQLDVYPLAPGQRETLRAFVDHPATDEVEFSAAVPSELVARFAAMLAGVARTCP